MTVVLDASALLAYLNDEPGAERVETILPTGAAISAANWAEVLSKTADVGLEPARLVSGLADSGLLGGALRIEPLLRQDAERMAELRPLTRKLGLSLGDRACLALAIRLGSPAYTTDRSWTRLDLPVPIEILR